MNKSTIQNNALEEFVRNNFEISVENSLIDQQDWEWGMEQLDDLISDAQFLRDDLDGMSHEEKLQWLKDNGLGYWSETEAENEQ